MKQKFLLLPVLFLFCSLLLCGCGDSSGSGNGSDPVSAKTKPPVISPPQVMIPLADGTEIVGSSPVVLDLSHADHGYLTVVTDPGDSFYNIRIEDPEEKTYSYFVTQGETAVIPFTGGDGTYMITVYEQIEDNHYSALFFHNLDLTLENDFYPFLYPNQYVNFNKDSEAVKLALSFLSEDATDLEILDEVYRYVTSSIVYDDEKAEDVEAGYLPDIDETLQSGTGICFDYAALMTAMLRARDIPCKLQIGYSSEIKHAWIDVYIRSIGWVDQAISFDGKSWSRMDPTFDSTGERSDSIREYIGDGDNYIVQFSR